MKRINRLLLFIIFLSSVALPAQTVSSVPTLPARNLEFPANALQRLEPLEDLLRLPPPEYPWRYVPQGYEVAGRWEVGFNVMPWISDNILTIVQLSQEQNEFSPFAQSFTRANGDQIELSFQDFLQGSTDKSFSVIYYHGELARQFANGFRVAVSVAVFDGNYPNEITVNDPVFQEVDFARFYEFQETGAFLNLHLQYTFNRRGRLRPALGLVYTTTLFHRFTEDGYLFDGEANRIVYQGASDFGFISGVPNHLIMPQFSLQYQLSRHFSIGIEVVAPLWNNRVNNAGLFGVGGRYQFGDGWPSYVPKEGTRF